MYAVQKVTAALEADTELMRIIRGIKEALV
jgi:hypothetical protein